MGLAAAVERSFMEGEEKAEVGAEARGGEELELDGEWKGCRTGGDRGNGGREGVGVVEECKRGNGVAVVAVVAAEAATIAAKGDRRRSA